MTTTRTTSIPALVPPAVPTSAAAAAAVPHGGAAVPARRDGSRMTGTATTHFSFGEFGMQPPQAAVVLSVVDDIRVEIAIVATQLT